MSSIEEDLDSLLVEERVYIDELVCPDDQKLTLEKTVVIEDVPGGPTRTIVKRLSINISLDTKHTSCCHFEK